MDEQEKKNRRVGLWLSIGIHGVVALILFFMVAWRAPDPPLPEYGIELNFGLDNQGTGDVQPDQPVGDQGESTATEEPKEAPAEQAEETPTVNDETTPDKAVEPVSKLESPVTVKEKETEKTPVKKPAKVESTAVSKEVVDIPKKEAEKELATVYTPKKGDAQSQGDDSKKAGDKGSEQGTPDSRTTYQGPPGAGGRGYGTNLDMKGWDWPEDVKYPTLTDDSPGRVTFDIECDEDGTITRINTSEFTLSPTSVKTLRNMLEKIQLERDPSAKILPSSKGKVTIHFTPK